MSNKSDKHIQKHVGKMHKAIIKHKGAAIEAHNKHKESMDEFLKQSDLKWQDNPHTGAAK